MTIKSLDGLRGLAVLLVLLSHLSLEGINLVPFLDFSGMGKAGVYLFFVLSAFLLTWQALAGEQDRPGTLTSHWYWLGYALRRFLRIYPLYCVVLIVSLIVTRYAPGYTPRIENPAELLEHLGLIAGKNIYWAIPVEFKYYLLLPVVALTLAFAARTHWLLAVAGIAVAIGGVYWYWPPGETAANAISLGPYLGIFLLGSLCALLCASDLKQQLAGQKLALGILGWLAIIAALATVPAFWRFIAEPEATNQVFHRAFLFYGLTWGIAVLAAMFGAGFFVRVFEIEPSRFVGRVSFSAYLWHYPIVQLFARDIALPATLEFLLAMTLIMVVSYVSYRFIERPFIAWGHRRTHDW